MFVILCFMIVLIKNTSSLDDEFILCRSCGNDIIKSHNIIERTSPASFNTFNDTLFNRENTLVQVLTKDIIFHFPIITSNHSNCVGFGEWEEEELWFPGYRWKPCLCPDCGVLIGWLFEKYNHSLNQAPEQFYALILPNLIGLKCKSWNLSPYTQYLTNMTAELSAEDKAFLALCEEEFKDRYTENDTEFMKVFNAEPSVPPILENWWVPNHSSRRFDRRNNRRFHPYGRERQNNRDRGYEDGRDNYNNRGYTRGYTDYDQGGRDGSSNRFQRN